MWIQIDDDKAKQVLELPEVLAIVPEDEVDPYIALLGYFRERVQHYSNINTPVAQKFRDAAQESASDGDLEVDDDAVVSMGNDPGAYVMCWKWIYNSAAGLEEDNETPSEELESGDVAVQ